MGEEAELQERADPLTKLTFVAGAYYGERAYSASPSSVAGGGGPWRLGRGCVTMKLKQRWGRQGEPAVRGAVWIGTASFAARLRTPAVARCGDCTAHSTWTGRADGMGTR
jgi:hypothetical protein